MWIVSSIVFIQKGNIPCRALQGRLPWLRYVVFTVWHSMSLSIFENSQNRKKIESSSPFYAPGACKKKYGWRR